MATNEQQLDLGLPAVPDPPVLTDDATRYGNALLGYWGTEASPTGFGAYVRRVPQDETLAIAANTGTTANAGAVLAVQATAGGFTGPLTQRITGAPATGEVRVDINADGTATLTTNAGDAVTSTEVRMLRVPAALITHLDATTDPA